MHAGESNYYSFANQMCSCYHDSLALIIYVIYHTDSKMRNQKKLQTFYTFTLIYVIVNLLKRKMASGFEIISI